MEFTPLPFEYEARYADLYRELGLTLDQAAVLEERDRQLEDHLAAFKANIAITQLSRTSDFSIPNATPTSVIWSSATVDELAIWDSGTPDRVTLTTDGTYLVSFSAKFAANGTGARIVYLRLNGTSVLGDFTAAPPTSAGDTSSVTITFPVQLSVDDYIEFRVDQTSGGSLTCLGSASGAVRASVLRLDN